MTGSSNLFLRMISVNTWDQLKTKLCDGFDKPLSTGDITQKLEAGMLKRKGENLHHYVLRLQKVEFIIDGLCVVLKRKCVFTIGL